MKQVMVGASRGRLPSKPWGQEDTHFIVRLKLGTSRKEPVKPRERHEAAVDSLCVQDTKVNTHGYRDRRSLQDINGMN
jgi:hypothetical protein